MTYRFLGVQTAACVYWIIGVGVTSCPDSLVRFSGLNRVCGFNENLFDLSRCKIWLDGLNQPSHSGNHRSGGGGAKKIGIIVIKTKRRRKLLWSINTATRSRNHNSISKI